MDLCSLLFRVKLQVPAVTGTWPMGVSVDSLLLTEPVRCWCQGPSQSSCGMQIEAASGITHGCDGCRERRDRVRERERASCDVASTFPSCRHFPHACSLPASAPERCLLMTGVPCLGDPDHKGVAAQGIAGTQIWGRDLECEHLR